MKKIKIYNFNTELYKVTGIQKVLMDIHNALKPSFYAKILGFTDYDKVDKNLGIKQEEYEKFRRPFKLRNSIIFIHERKLLPLMFILTHIPFLNIKCVYVHHNELYGNKLLSFFPKNIVAISDAGIRNLTEYFGIPENNITKIHNCVRQPGKIIQQSKSFNKDCIRILYPARINSVKQQVEIVKRLRGQLDKRIKILFAGTGPDYENLLKECADSDQFIPLGFRSDVLELMAQNDFVMLFSKHEGLPISLIEATMVGTPIITNSVGGNVEIAFDNKNAFIANEWSQLLDCLNNLPNLSIEDYSRMVDEGHDIYEKEFTFDTFKGNYTTLIEKICQD